MHSPTSDVGDERSKPFEAAGIRRAPFGERETPPSHASVRRDPVDVLRFASRIAFTRYSRNRSAVIGHTPTRVWYDEQLLGPVGRVAAAHVQRRGVPAIDELDATSSGGAVSATEPGAHVRAALRVVGLRGRAGSAGSARRALARWPVERVDRTGRTARVAAHLVEREQADVAVARGVLDALGHDRAAIVCWKRVTSSAEPGALVEQEQRAQAFGTPGERPPVGVVDDAVRRARRSVR